MERATAVMHSDRRAPTSDPRDITFSVPMTHRLRFTEDVAGDDFYELLALLLDAEHSDAPATTAVGATAAVGATTAVGATAAMRASHAALPKVIVWADSEVANASDRVARVATQLRESKLVVLSAPVSTFAGGEAVKNAPDVIPVMLEQINQCNLDRRSYIIAIGGGALLDVAGYAAAIAHRGVRLIRIPTTTLAQADSGVGVKNAINQFGKKNWVGTFTVPWAVINDSGFLTTLPDREFSCGFSEAVKVSLLKSRTMFDSLCRNATQIAGRDMTIAKQVIAESCRMHLHHITHGGDPFESLESRPLDFGHWSAHRLEPMTDYSIRHGEAVAIGVSLDTWYSSIRHGFPDASAAKVCRCLADLGLPLWDDALNDFDAVLLGLEEFRQHLGGRLTVTMLRDIADPIDVHEIDADAMRMAATRLREFSLKLRAPASV